MNQVCSLCHFPSKEDNCLSRSQQLPIIMEEEENNKGFQIGIEERRIKVALIIDSKQYKVNIVLPCTQGTQAVSLFTSHFKVEHMPTATVDESFFQNIYYPTCLITNQAIHATFCQAITRCFYISQVIIIQQPCYLPAPIEPTTKIIRIREQELINTIKQPVAHNFLVARDKKSYQFKQKVRDILQLKRSIDFKTTKWRKYLKITGFGEEEAKDFMGKYLPSENNVLSLYSQSSHFYHINIVLRRCNHPQALQYIGLIGIAVKAPPRQIPSAPQVCYRGGSIGLQQLQQLSSASVQPVVCRYFMSCSLNPNVAQMFRINCIFQIHFWPDSGCAILQDSVYGDEQEVIFSILGRFQVQNIRENRMWGRPGWYVVLNYEGPTILDLI